MTPSQPPYKLQQWPAHLLVLTACGVLLLTCLPLSATLQFAWPWAGWMQLAWLAPLVATGGRMFFRPEWQWPDRWFRGALSLLFIWTLLSAALSPLAVHSLLRIWPTVGGIALFLWLIDWLQENAADRRSRIKRLAQGLAWLGLLLPFVSLCEWLWHNGGVHWGIRNEYPFGHSIYTAGALVLLLPWIALAVYKTVGARRAAWVVAGSLALLTLFSTSSRGGVIALGGLLLATAVLAVLHANWSRQRKFLLLLSCLLLLILAIGSNPRLRETVSLGGWSESAQASNEQRRAMLEAGAKLGAQRPLLGWGPGTVPLIYPKIRHELSGGVDSVLQLHNTPAQLWATLGVGGALVMGMLLVSIWRQAWSLFRPRLPSSHRLAATASLFGYGLFCLTDHQLDVPMINGILVVIAVLFFHAPSLPGKPLLRATKWYLGLTTSCLLLIPALLAARDLWARFAYHQSLVLFSQSRINLALDYLESAANRAPYDPYYRQQLAGRYLSQRKMTDDPVIREQLSAEATVQLQRSLSAGCLQEYAHFNLGWLALEKKQSMDAVLYFLATLHEAPHRAGAYFGLGLALRDLGNEPAAVRAFALEWINDPLSFTSPLWESPDVAAIRPKIHAEAETILTELAPRQPTARYLLALWRWWGHIGPFPENPPMAEPARFHVLSTTQFSGQTAPTAQQSKFPWERLHHIWAQASAHPDEWLLLAEGDRDFAVALQHRAQRHPPPDWQGFLCAGVENEGPLLQSVIFQRLGYGVLARHPKGPVLENLYVHHQNRFTAKFSAGLFPPRGWLSARTLKEWLPAQAYRP